MSYLSLIISFHIQKFLICSKTFSLLDNQHILSRKQMSHFKNTLIPCLKISTRNVIYCVTLSYVQVEAIIFLYYYSLLYYLFMRLLQRFEFNQFYGQSATLMKRVNNFVTTASVQKSNSLIRAVKRGPIKIS